jgi:tetratricopeptide (TPR) repeat protein
MTSLSSTAGRSGQNAGWLPLAGLLLLLIITWALLAPASTAPPMFDDEDTLHHATTLEGWQRLYSPDSFGLFRPFKNLLFGAFAGRNPIDLRLWHATCLSFFLLATGAVFLLARRLFSSSWWALATAAAWALCPTITSTAVWMSCANISLCASFLCLFLVLHLRATESGKVAPGSLAAASLALFLAQASYESAVCGIGLAAAIDFLVRGASPGKWSRPAYVSYLVVTIAFLVLRDAIGSTLNYRDGNPGISPETDPLRLFLSAPWFLRRHLSMWLFPPGNQEFLGTYQWGQSATVTDLVVSWVLLAGLPALAFALRRKVPLAAAGLVWFLLAAAPSSNFLPTYSGPVEDYYLTIPSIGLALAVVAVIRRLATVDHPDPSLSRAGWIFAIALAIWRIGLVPLVPLQAAMWKEPVRLLLQSYAVRPGQYLNGALAARELYLAGRDDEALKLLGEIERNPHSYAVAPMVEGFIHLRASRLDEAMACLEEAIRVSSTGTQPNQSSRIEAAKILLRRGNELDRARELLLPVLDHGFDEMRVRAIHLLAEVYLAKGDRPKAVETFRKGKQLYPAEPSFQELPEVLREPSATPGVKSGATPPASPR